MSHGPAGPHESEETTNTSGVSANEGRWDNIAKRVARYLWFDAFFNIEDRYVASNQLITGGPNDGGPDGWATLRQIDLEPHVDDYAGGFALGAGNVVVTYLRVARAAEFRLVGLGDAPLARPHYFGSLSIMLMRNLPR
jgi:hypothetical protein